MDWQGIVNTISTVGFPICVTLICFWYINKMQETHRDETNKLTEALNNNTLAMQQLVDKLDAQVVK